MQGLKFTTLPPPTPPPTDMLINTQKTNAAAREPTYGTAGAACFDLYACTIDGKRLTRADLANIQLGIATWEGRVARLTAGGMQVREVIPR